MKSFSLVAYCLDSPSPALLRVIKNDNSQKVAICNGINDMEEAAKQYNSHNKGPEDKSMLDSQTIAYCHHMVKLNSKALDKTPPLRIWIWSIPPRQKQELKPTARQVLEFLEQNRLLEYLCDEKEELSFLDIKLVN